MRSAKRYVTVCFVSEGGLFFFVMPRQTHKNNVIIVKTVCVIIQRHLLSRILKCVCYFKAGSLQQISDKQTQTQTCWLTDNYSVNVCVRGMSDHCLAVQSY